MQEACARATSPPSFVPVPL